MAQTHQKQINTFRYLTDNQTKTILYGGGAGGGKTWLGCFWVYMMARKYPRTKWFIGRQELKRLRRSTYITWKKVCKHYKFYSYKTNWKDNVIILENGSEIDLLDLQYKPSDPLYERFGSLEYTGGFIEECGEVNFGAYDVLRTRIGRHMNKEYGILSTMLLTCNPKKNWTYTEFYKPFKEGKLPKDVKFIQSLVTDNPFIDQNYIDNLKATKDEAKKQRLLYGNWEYDDDPTILVQYENIIEFVTKKSYSETEETRYITCDIALHGSDRFVVFVWQGWTVIDFKVLERSDGKKVVEVIEELAEKHTVLEKNICYDADGIGGFIQGFLVQSLAFNNNATAIEVEGEKEQYKNLKSQCYFRFAEKVERNEVHTAKSFGKYTDLIKEELECVKNHSYGTDNKLSILPKKEVKEIIGRSPDFSDSLMMRCYFDLVYQKSNVRFVFADKLKIVDQLPDEYSHRLYLYEYLENSMCSIVEFRRKDDDFYFDELLYNNVDIKELEEKSKLICDPSIQKVFRDKNQHIATNVSNFRWFGTNDESTFINKLKMADSLKVTSSSKNLIDQLRRFQFLRKSGIVTDDFPKLTIDNMMIFSMIPLV